MKLQIQDDKLASGVVSQRPCCGRALRVRPRTAAKARSMRLSAEKKNHEKAGKPQGSSRAHARARAANPGAQAGFPQAIHQQRKTEPNKALEPTPVAVTNRAFPPFGRARIAPSTSVAQL